jgi:FlaA1/EpsC-like NDP-sugar epimerase
MRYKSALIDAVVVAASYFFALSLRLLDPDVTGAQQYLYMLATVMPIIIALQVGSNIALGAYGRIWDYGSVTETKRVGIASAIVMPILLGLVAIGRELEVVVPSSTVLLGGVVALIGMGLVRFLARHTSRKVLP